MKLLGLCRSGREVYARRQETVFGGRGFIIFEQTVMRMENDYENCAWVSFDESEGSDLHN
jgi:hypothetical protein